MESSSELIELTKRCYAAIRAGDDETIRGMFSDHPSFLFLGTDPDERFESADEATGIFRAQWDDLGGCFPMFEGDRLEAWVDGNLGWTFDEPRLEPPFPEGTTLRLTIVWLLERGYWRIVHWTASLPVGNVESLGVELTTSIGVVAEAVAVERTDVSPATALDGTVTIMFTDIVESTALTSELGDHAWMELLRHHHQLVRKHVGEWDGTEVKSIGDGFMLAFASARSALGCAHAIHDAVGDVLVPGDRALAVRIGVHVGEPIREGDDFYGTTVNTAARVASAAGPGEVLATDLVRAIVEPGGGFSFGQPRTAELKGLPSPQTLFPVAAESG